MAKVKNYYAGTNSSVGFYSLYDEALAGLETLYILKGGPGTGKSTFMRKIGLVFMDKGYDLEYLHCSSDNHSIDGIVIPQRKLGFVDGTAPHVIEPKYPGVVEKVIDLGQFRNDEYLKEFKSEIIELTDDISKNFENAYKTFAEAKKVHLKREDIYVSSMSFKKADMVLENLIDAIFSKSFEAEENPTKRKRFFGAATPKGAVNFIDNITEEYEKRYIIKGRPGSGKSTLMRKIAKYAEQKGLSVEYFHCAFDPKSIDMIIIPKLSVSIVDGTAPHVVDPFREHDEVIDMFALCMDPKIENTFKKEIEELNLEYKSKMTIGTNYLSEAKRLHDKLEEYYRAAMDFEAIDRKREEIVKTLLEK
ncbi:PRK06851 family protein [Bacillus nitroreducens]